MSVKIVLQALVLGVSPINEVVKGDTTTRIQNLVVNQPGYTDQFGDKKGKDETWCFQLFGNKIEELKLKENFKAGDKVTVTGYIKGYSWEKDGNINYGFNADLFSVQYFNK